MGQFKHFLQNPGSGNQLLLDLELERFNFILNFLIIIIYFNLVKIQCKEFKVKLKVKAKVLKIHWASQSQGVVNVTTKSKNP